MELAVLCRHGQTTYNVERRVNGDPTVPVALSPAGEEQARMLGRQLAALPVDLLVHSPFPRARQTAELALEGRDVPAVEEPLLGDLDVGDLEGWDLDAYRAFEREHARHTSYPGGESRAEAARRYAEALRSVAARPERTILVVTHELAIRFAVNALAGAPGLDEPRLAIPNATPFLFPAAALADAAGRIDELARDA